MPDMPFKIGADPEFTYVNNNTRYSAREIISQFCKNKPKFITEGREMGYIIDEAGTLGWDGHEASGEIRPKENSDPQKVTDNIRTLLLEAHKCMPAAEMKTTSIWMSIGGHIHLEARDYRDRSSQQQKVIQRALASLALPLLANENPINVEIRKEKGLGYGDILDARVNGITYEFRPLTAEWITTPEICNATLAYLGVIWNEIYNHPEKIEAFAEIIAKSDQQIRALQEIMIDEYGALSDGLINRIKGYVRKFELYEQYKAECELIFDKRKVKQMKEKVEFDIVRGWKFNEAQKFSFPKIKEIMDEKLTQEKLKDLDMGGVNDYLQIFWAQERNMEKVARRIGDTAIAWNWTLRHRYFMFPLEKGIPSTIMINGKNEFMAGKEMIKTQGDYAKMQEIKNNANALFARKEEFKRTSINLSTGKTETDEHKSIMIGIPYSAREEVGGVEEILAMIYKNETRQLKPSILENIKDLNLPETHPEFKEGYLMEKTKPEKTPRKRAPKPLDTENINDAVRIATNRTIATERTQEMLTQAEMGAFMNDIQAVFNNNPEVTPAILDELIMRTPQF